MDTELIITFLEVVACKSFIGAARRLNIAQTTVSARIRTLETELGQRLLERHKGGTTLTPAGEQLMEHAPELVKLWQRMKHQVGAPKAGHAHVTIGAEINLWQPLVHEWVQLCSPARHDISLRTHVDVRENLIKHVVTGLVDIAVIYAPPQHPDLTSDLLLDERLVLVTTDPNTNQLDTSTFISVDWGPEFAQSFSASFPEMKAAALSTNLGALALQYILKNGGSAYFTRRMVEPHLVAGNLHLALGTPQFPYPIQTVSLTASELSLLAPVLACLKTAVAAPA